MIVYHKDRNTLGYNLNTTNLGVISDICIP